MKQGKSTKRSLIRRTRLVCITSLVITLFTLGVIGLVRLMGWGLGDKLSQNFSFSVELPERMSSVEINTLVTHLRAHPEIHSLHLISADSALSQLREEIREDPVALLGYNPLHALLQIQPQAAYLHIDSLPKIEQLLSKEGISTPLNYRPEVVELVQGKLSKLEWILWLALAVQLIITAVQLSNTIRLLIHADRLQIRTLTLVGASPWFVRRPIIWRSIGDALIASIVALLLLVGAIYGLGLLLETSLLELLPLHYTLLGMGTLTLVAVLVSACAAWRNTHRYIRMDSGKIHLI